MVEAGFPKRKHLKSQRGRDAEAARQVAAWTHPIGTPVEVFRDSGKVEQTKTRSAPAILCGGAVIWLDGIASCYALDRVRIARKP